MNRIVDDILKAEEDARRIIEEARKKAIQLKSEAQSEINESLDTARRHSQERLREGIELARKRAKKEYESAVGDAQAVAQKFVEGNKNRIEEVAQQIVEFVITPEHKKR